MPINKGKFSETFTSILNLIKSDNFNDELYDKIDFFLRNDPENYMAFIALSKQLLSKNKDVDFAFQILKEIYSNEEIAEPIRSRAKFEHGRALVQLRQPAEAYDLFVELIPSSYGNLAYIEIGRILYRLGYSKLARTAFEKVDNQVKRKNLAVDISKTLMPERKFIAASNNLCEYIKNNSESKDSSKLVNAHKQFIYFHVKNKNFERAWEYFLRLPKELVQSDVDLQHICYFLRGKLESSLREKFKDIDYELNIKRDHFIKQLDDYDPNYVKKMHCERLYNFPVNNVLMGADLTNLYTYAKAVVDYSEPTKISFVEYYTFDYKCDIATIYGHKSSRVMVGVLPNTKDIISIKVIPRLDDPEKFLVKKRNPNV